MSKKLRGAVVGVGYLGTFHAQKYKNNPNVVLVGVCDHSPAQADKVAAELGVSAIHKAEDLVGQVDLVSIAANTLNHFELAKLYLSNGIHVNVEKPITATVEQAQELLAIAAAKNVKLAVGHIERFNPSINELKKHMKNVRVIELTRLANYKARGADVSVLHDLMIHDIDLMYWLSGSDVESFDAAGMKLISPELDTGTATFKMKNGITVIIQVSRVSPIAQRSIRVIQDDGILFANTGIHELEKVSAGNGATSTEPIRVTKWTVSKEDALQKETDAFINAVLNNTDCTVTGLDGLKALKTVEDVVQMIEKKK